MRIALHDHTPLIHPDNNITQFNSCQTMCNNDARYIFWKAINSMLYAIFIRLIQCTRCFIKNKELRICIQRAIDTRCACPPERPVPFSPIDWCTPNGWVSRKSIEALRTLKGLPFRPKSFSTGWRRHFPPGYQQTKMGVEAHSQFALQRQPNRRKKSTDGMSMRSNGPDSPWKTSTGYFD